MAEVRQAGAIAVRIDDGEVRFLLVTARRDPSQWIFPKGHIEPGESASAAALRELAEEAGVKGRLAGEIGVSRFRDETRDGGRDLCVTYFLVRASTGGRSMEGRRLDWLPANVARERLAFDRLRALLDAARARLSSLARSKARGARAGDFQV